MSTVPATAAGQLGGEPSPARWVGEVPVGWPETRQGVVAAAASDATAFSALWFMTDTTRRHRTVELLAAPGIAAALQADQDRDAAAVLAGPFGAGLARAGVRSLLRTALLGWRLDDYRPDRAVVTLWAVVVWGNDGGLAPQTTWTTTVARLVWADDWKLAGIDSTPGPVPVEGPTTPTAPAELLAAATTLKGFLDVPAA